MTSTVEYSAHESRHPDEPATLADLPGIWRRSLLVTADGMRDEVSPVYWLQSANLYGDIRLDSGDRSDVAPAMRGFAGRLGERDGIFRWVRTIASFPLDGPPDDGRLCWQGSVLREDGVHSPYLELWVRVALPVPGDYAAELIDPESGRLGYLLSLGGFRYFGRGGKADGIFDLAGVDSGRAPLTMTTEPQPSTGWNGIDAPGLANDRMRIAERGADGEMHLKDWSIIALERPFELSSRSARSEGKVG